MPARLKNRVIMVLGMHRSGTSAFTGVLRLMGVALGSRLLPASSTNQSGYWEQEEVVSIHDSLLMALGSKWDDPSSLPADWWKSEPAAAHRAKLLEIIIRDFAGSALWALKDPRLCRLIPLWTSMLDELECEAVWVILARHPSESIRSLADREGFPSRKSELLWLRYTLDAELGTRGRNRVVIPFDQLLDNWEETLPRVQRALGVPWPVSLEDAGAQVREFLNPAQRHHYAREAGEISEWTREAYEGLLAGAFGDEAKMRDLLDRARAVVDPAVTLYHPWIEEEAARYAALSDAFREAKKKHRLTKEKLAVKSAELKTRKEQVREFERSMCGKLRRFFNRSKLK